MPGAVRRGTDRLLRGGACLGTKRKSPAFTIGIEEEFFLVRCRTRNVVEDPPRAFLADCVSQLGSHVSCEYLRCQVETNTQICETIDQVRGELTRLRDALARS